MQSDQKSAEIIEAEVIPADEKSTEIAKTQSASNVQQINSMLEMAISKDLDIEKLERLMNLQERYIKEEARKTFFESLSGFQSEIPTIRKEKTASFKTSTGWMEYNFASLDTITETIRPYLSKHGLSYRFEQKTEGALIKVKCIVTHSDGHTESCEMEGAPDGSGKKNNLQQSASTFTYLRRYTLCGALGIATAEQDIDGHLPEQESPPPGYPAEKWEAHFAEWKAAVEAGKKTPDQILKMVKAKCVLTDQQVQQIEALA